MLAATPAGVLAVVVHHSAAVRRPTADFEAGLVPVPTVEIDVAAVVLDRFIAALAEERRHVLSLTPTPQSPSPNNLET